ncbi:hypothetical protein H5410_041432 [Solanum commersonii]|uniref:Uncharacterized protein n=1 Tax=Solanum commersonii TaxID=4109 RepID=A0A9J5XVH2_SOLCO|nr:hypothetical protein H5410_041432 [Solanum commersonii]
MLEISALKARKHEFVKNLKESMCLVLPQCKFVGHLRFPPSNTPPQAKVLNLSFISPMGTSNIRDLLTCFSPSLNFFAISSGDGFIKIVTTLKGNLGAFGQSARYVMAYLWECLLVLIEIPLSLVCGITYFVASLSSGDETTIHILMQ